jgi:hypothetical protein
VKQARTRFLSLPYGQRQSCHCFFFGSGFEQTNPETRGVAVAVVLRETERFKQFVPIVARVTVETPDSNESLILAQSERWRRA